MRKELTDITVVMDRSGSMVSCQSDAEGGLNQFVKDQLKEPGEAVFTLVQFDDVYEVVHDGVRLQDVPHISLVPRALTALYDAVGKAINVTGERLLKLAEADRPGLVVFMIITDGLNNASREFSIDQIKEKIQHQENEYSWKFIFLGANMDAFAAGGSLGVRASGIANYTPSTVKHAYGSTSSNVARMRCAVLSSEPAKNEFTEEELEAMKGNDS